MKDEKSVSIVHLAIRHPWDDARVFARECVELASNRTYRVALFAVGEKAETRIESGVHITTHNTPVLQLFRSVFHWLRKQSPQIIHCHETESLLFAIIYKVLCNWRVDIIFDVHEYFFLYSKNKNKKMIARIWYLLWSIGIEPFALRFVRAMFCVTQESYDYYKNYKGIKAVLHNYPREKTFDEAFPNNRLDTTKQYLVYHGSITKNRGVFACLELLDQLPDNICFLLMGAFKKNSTKEDFFKKVKAYGLEQRVMYTGRFSREETLSYLKNDVPMIGLSLFSDIPSFRYAISLKMLEYLHLGILQIGTDTQHYFDKIIVNECNAGVSVSLDDVGRQKQLVVDIFTKNMQFDMQQTGRYTWEQERSTLLDVYNKIVD